MNKPKMNQRTVGIIAAVILGTVVAVYLGGLFTQLNTSYQKWLAADGIVNQTPMDPVNYSPLYCIPHALSEEGRRITPVVFLGIGAIFIFVKLHSKWGKGEFDDRNFRKAREGTYGTAGWMSDKEMKSVLEVTSPASAKGIILGEKNGKVICLPENTRLNKHIFVCGASGTRKSRAIVRNHIFQSIKREESVVLTDPKAELYDDTAEMFRQNGYEVKVFNLVNPEHSDSWNCMADLHGDTMMSQILTDVIINNTSKGKIDHFWDNGEGNLLKSLVLYVDQDGTRGLESKHLPAVYQMLTTNSEHTLSAMFNKLPITHPAKAPYNLFAQASDTVRAGIVLGLGTRLQILQNESIRKILSNSDIDLAEPGRKKCAYFVILSDQEGSTEFLSSLFFSFLFIKLTRYADSMPEKRCKVPVNIIFEELNNVGQLDSYPRRLSVMRSRSLQAVHIVQSLAQFKNRYPLEQWAEIIGNCDTQIMLGVTEEDGAEFFSLRSGDMTVMVNSTMTVKQTIALTQLIPQYRESEGFGKRRLLTPDEVLRFPDEECIIVIRGQNILRANKFDCTGHPYAKKMIPTSIFDYYPKEPSRFQVPASPEPQPEAIQATTDTKPARSPMMEKPPSSQTEKRPPAARRPKSQSVPPPQTEIEGAARGEPVLGGLLYGNAKPPEDF